MEKVWTEYDPKKANDLLDGLGLKKGADGIRLRPDGQPLAITIEHATAPGLAVNDMHELVRKAWTAIGINTSVKGVDRALYMEHYRSGEHRGRPVGLGPRLGQQGRPWPLARHDRRRPVGADVRPLVRPERLEEGRAAGQDHPIRKIWDFWEKCRTEPDEAKSNA